VASLFDRIGNVRDRLRHSRANRPGDGDCLRALCDHTKILRAKRKNTGLPWDLADKKIYTVSDKAKYQINDVRFGTPLAVLTIDDSNPSHFQRIIPFFAPQNLAFSWGLPSNVGSFVYNWDGSTHSAQRVAFYWANGVPYLEFQPTPQASATYLLRYVVGNSVDAMSLSDPLSLGEVGDTLAEVRAATSLLPFADWDDSESQNKEKRIALGTTLNWEDGLLLQQYDADVMIHTGSTIGDLWSPEESY
jgi:hypothetical protein